MHNQRDSWTVALVIAISIIAVKLGVQNLEWGLKTAGDALSQIQTGTKGLPEN